MKPISKKTNLLINSLNDQTRATSNLFLLDYMHLKTCFKKNITILWVDDLDTKSQDEGVKHILEVDDLYTNSQDGYNNTILEFDDLYTKSQDADKQHFLKVDFLHTQ